MSLRRQLPLFLVIGTASAAFDAVVYAATSALGLPVAAAKALGFVTGAAFGFVANGRRTFAGPHGRGALARFALVYASSLQLNVFLNAVVLATLSDIRGGSTVAFLAATACSATTNFVGMKYLAFRAADMSAPA